MNKVIPRIILSIASLLTVIGCNSKSLASISNNPERQAVNITSTSFIYIPEGRPIGPPAMVKLYIAGVSQELYDVGLQSN